jgi:GAF domain-containing protein
MATVMVDRPHLVSTDETAEQAALYCLGDFPPEDRKSYEEHLSSCAACRAEVEACSAVIVDLALADPRDLPSRVRSDFLTRVHNEKASGRHWAKLISVIITPQLSARPTLRKNRDHVSAALDKLARRLSGSEQELLDALVRAALELCDAGTAGFSVLYEDEQVFRWDALAGALAGAKGGTTPRAWSPCGTTLDFGTPQLFSNPSRCFEYFKNSPHQIFEGLVVPVYVGEKPLGTLWVASHDDRKFDKEDLQVLQSFADFCGTAIGAMRERQANQGSDARG